MTAQTFFQATCEQIGDAKKGAMFGWECYKCGTRPFAFFDQKTEAAAAFKLSGEIRDEALALDGVEVFNPGEKGRPMKNWVVVPFFHKGKWARFALAAFEEVLVSPVKIKKKHGK